MSMHVSCGAAHPVESIGEMKIAVAFQQVRRLIVVRTPGGAMHFGWSVKYLIFS